MHRRIVLGIALAASITAQGLPTFELAATFAPPCRPSAGISLCSDGLAVLNGTGDTLFVADRASGSLLRTTALHSRTFGFLASNGTVVHGWCSADSGIYRIDDTLGTSEPIGTPPVTSPVFAVTDTHAYVIRDERTWSAVLTRVTLSDGAEKGIGFASGYDAALHRDRYFWYFLNSGGGYFTNAVIYDLSLPEEPVGPWNWSPISDRTGQELPCRGCRGVAKDGDTLWVYNETDTLICRISVGYGAAVVDRMPCNAVPQPPGCVRHDLRGRLLVRRATELPASVVIERGSSGFGTVCRVRAGR